MSSDAGHRRKTLLCVPIFVDNLEAARRDIALSAEFGADLVELRIDGFDGDIRPLVQQSLLPVIVTCRAASEGGRSTEDDAQRIGRLDAIGTQAAYVDIELQTIANVGLARERFPRVIVSTHDFAGRPERFYPLVEELLATPASVHKIVWTARTVRDNLEAFELLRDGDAGPLIALCMGEAGLISRILTKKFGGFLSFASLGAETGTAPGQVTIQEMKRLYRWDQIGPDTKVYGVVGSPVSHSMSPAIHNAAFDETGHDGIYLPFLVNPGYESFKAFMESFIAFRPLSLSGLSVTIPHKENAIRYLKEKGAIIDELSERIGAVNTIRIDYDRAEPRLAGSNTDYPAIIDCVTDALGVERAELKRYRVAVIGAGGTGRTAVAAFAELGATVVVYNRTREKAEALAAEFNGRTGKVVSAGFDRLCDNCCQIIINTTSLGMSPNIHASPFDPGESRFSSDTLVLDCVYNPIETRLLAEARSAGAKTISGVEMFLRQAGLQFTAWTDKVPPLSLMRSVVEAKLGI